MAVPGDNTSLRSVTTFFFDNAERFNNQYNTLVNLKVEFKVFEMYVNIDRVDLDDFKKAKKLKPKSQEVKGNL